MPFDPSKPFEVESQPAVAFDPSLPFEVEAATAAAPAPVRGASPTAQQEAFRQQFIQANTQTPTQQVLGALTAAPRAGLNMAKGLGEIALKGVQGVGSLYGEAAGQPTLADTIKNFNANAAQTALEILPRMAFELGQGGVAGFQSPETATSTLRQLGAISNPIASAIQAAAFPQAAPTQARAQQAFQESLVNEALAKQGEQGVLETAQRAAGGGPIGTANIDVARAAPILAPLAGATPALVRGGAAAIEGAVAPIIRRSLPATVEQSAMAALDVTAEEAARHIPIVNQRILEIAKTAPKTASEALKAANTAEASLYQDALVADRAATKQGLAPRADLIMVNVEETLNNIPSLLPEERTALLADARARYSDVSTTAKGRALQQRLNKEFEAQYANDTFDRAAPANEVKLAVRNSIAEQMDEINKAVTGLDASPYSDIGSLIEFKGNLNKTLQNIQRAEARQKTGIGTSKSTSVPTTKVQAIYQTKKSLLSPFQRTQLEALDSNVSKIFKQGERAGEAAALDVEVQQGLVSKYSQQAPPPLPKAAAVPSLEAQIQATIKSLPKEMRGRNERAIAEAILRSQASP